MPTYTLNSELYLKMLRGGTSYLHQNAETVDRLNVFPIPDGDTGDNMCLTMEGGLAAASGIGDLPLGNAAKKIASGMLLGARGNSGVILSQFFGGLAEGLSGTTEADAPLLAKAFESGVRHAYASVITPTEGTILTVARESTAYASKKLTARKTTSLEEFFSDFLEELHRSLARTPDLLPVLKEAGVIDSGGAGFSYIMEGMNLVLCGQEIDTDRPADSGDTQKAPCADFGAFGPDSEMEYGYCTEFLLQLQNKKTNVEEFDVQPVIDDLISVGGESIVAVLSGSVLKVHVHTMTPGVILNYAQTLGEFLTVKIENMTIQHSETEAGESALAETVLKEPERKKHTAFAVVAVTSGKGIADALYQLGADIIVEGGQTSNPSAEDFLEAFEQANADTIFVFPNNPNVFLSARQAASMYDKAEVRILPSNSIGDCYAAVSMLDYTSGDADRIEKELCDAMQGARTGLVTYSVRDATLNGVTISCGDWIGFEGKEMLASAEDKVEAAGILLDRMQLDGSAVLIGICGKDCSKTEMRAVRQYVKERYPDLEWYEIDGQQDVYSFIFIAE